MNPDGGSRYESFFTRQSALIISGAYLAFGATYIYFSGWLVLRLYSEPVDVARIEMYKGWIFVFSSSALLFIAVHLAAKALRRSTERQLRAVKQYQQMIETTNEGVWRLDANARTTFVNQTMADMLGCEREDIIDKPEVLFLDESWNAVAVQQLQRLQSGTRDVYECKFKRFDDAPLWTLIAASPVTDENGNFDGVLRMATNITERKETELALHESLSAQRRLLNELDHRVRNNLSSLISLIDVSRGTSESPEVFASSIRGRIDAMNRAHTLLSASGWKHQDLGELLDVLIPNHCRTRVSTDGPSVRCAADVSGAMAVLFHELIANALEHGSLSHPKGLVAITWRVVSSSDSESTAIELTWCETGGPSPKLPVEHGAGLRLVVGLVQTDFRGSANFDFPEEGAHHRLHLTLASAAPSSNGSRSSASQPSGSTSTN